MNSDDERPAGPNLRRRCRVPPRSNDPDWLSFVAVSTPGVAPAKGAAVHRQLGGGIGFNSQTPGYRPTLRGCADS
jgi:hypothetical protein